MTLTLGPYMGKENTMSKWIKLDVDEFKLKQEFLQRFSGPQPLPSNKAKTKQQSSLNYAENYSIVFSLNCTENIVDFALKKDC